MFVEISSGFLVLRKLSVFSASHEFTPSCQVSIGAIAFRVRKLIFFTNFGGQNSLESFMFLVSRETAFMLSSISVGTEKLAKISSTIWSGGVRGPGSLPVRRETPLVVIPSGVLKFSGG